MDEKFFSTEKGEITIIFNEFQIPFVSIDGLSFVIEFLTRQEFWQMFCIESIRICCQNIILQNLLLTTLLIIRGFGLDFFFVFVCFEFLFVFTTHMS